MNAEKAIILTMEKRIEELEKKLAEAEAWNKHLEQELGKCFTLGVQITKHRDSVQRAARVPLF